MKRSIWQYLLITVVLLNTVVVGLSTIFLVKRPSRNIEIQRHLYGGVVILRGNKVKVNGTTLTARLPVHTTNVLEFLLLTNAAGLSFTTGLLQILLAGLIIYYLWHVNLNDPFDYRTYIAVKYAGVVYIVLLAIVYLGQLYTRNLLTSRLGTLADFEYHVQDFSFIKVIVAATLVNFYRIATYNQQQQELTV